jgi:hypothetical protein
VKWKLLMRKATMKEKSRIWDRALDGEEEREL